MPHEIPALSRRNQTGASRVLLSQNPTGRLSMWTARVLVAAVLVLCAASSSDARRRHHGYYGGYGERYSTRGTLDEWRARQAQGQNREPYRDYPRGQARGDDRAETRDPARGDEHGADGAQNRAQDGVPDRWQDRRSDRRRARYDDRRRWRDREDLTRARAAERGDLVLDRGRSGPFGARVIARRLSPVIIL